MDLTPLEPLDIQDPKPGLVAAAGSPKKNFKRWILPAGIVMGILLAVGIYLLVGPASEKLIAQVLKFDIATRPDTARVVLSISNKQDSQVIIVKLYPLFYGKEYAGIFARSIEGSTIEGVTLPLLNESRGRTCNQN